MDRSRKAHGRNAMDDYLLDADPVEDPDVDELAGLLAEDDGLADVDDGVELDDQELELARLLGQDV